MYIKQFASTRFAGLKNVSLDFDNGLNVIVGANETGKSTIVNAIFSVLFSNTNLKMSRKEDKEFLSQSLPHSSGDFIDGTVYFYFNNQEYLLQKKWGNRSSISLKKPDGSIITVENDVEELMKTIFELGPRTYQNIVFARQSQLKEVLANLRDTETVQSISSLLRKAVMNLDGVSIEKLRIYIDEELDNLLKKWDFENNRPQGTKAYKTGLGEVINSYYSKEKLKAETNRIFSIEQDLHNISMQLQAGETKQKEIINELTTLEPMEEDILKRAEMEPRLESIKIKSNNLKSIATKWPKCEHELQTREEKLKTLLSKMQLIRDEENACNSQKEKEALANIIKTVNENRQSVELLNEELKALPVVIEEDIRKLEALNRKIMNAETSMKAGKMLASIRKKQDIDIWVTRDLEDETEFLETEVDANGYIKIRFGEIAEIEVKSGEFDFNRLKEDYETAQADLTEHLNNLGVKDVAEARQCKKELDSIKRKIDSTELLTDKILGKQNYEEIKTKLEALSTKIAVRPINVIIKDKEDLEKALMDLKVSINSLKKDLTQWEENYTNNEKLLDDIIDLGMQLKGLEQEMGKLQPLPEGFINASAFRIHLKKLREEKDEVRESLRQCWKAHDDKERELPDESYEELKVQYELACKDLDKKLARAAKMMKIKEVFDETLAEMDSNSIQPLVDSFSKYLSQTTLGNYKLGSIDEDFELDMIRSDDVAMPVNLLSSGTYDSVALSLRFAMLEHAFAQAHGFVVLDDCLVDLDPDRRGEAIKIIREYAHNNQVIFTTCSPETAQLLGGKIIEL